jgi:protein required for attachment to host cells
MNAQTANQAVPVWVIVADSGRARIFSATSRTAPLDEKEVLINPEGRLHDRDLTTDLPGRTFSRVGSQRAAMTTEVDPKQHDVIMFAKQVAQRLDQGRTHGEYQRLVLVASPAFLGLLRENLDKHVREQVALTIDKDLTQLRADELRARLPKRLP